MIGRESRKALRLRVSLLFFCTMCSYRSYFSLCLTLSQHFSPTRNGGCEASAATPEWKHRDNAVGSDTSDLVVVGLCDPDIAVGAGGNLTGSAGSRGQQELRHDALG